MVKKVDYTFLAILELMRANYILYGEPYGKYYGKYKKRISSDVFNILDQKFHKLFKKYSEIKNWGALDTAFSRRGVIGESHATSLASFARRYKTLIQMPQDQYEALDKFELEDEDKRLVETHVKDVIKLKDVFELVAFTIIDNHVENPEFDIKDFLKNAAQKRLKWPENKTGLRLPYIWQEIVDLAQSEKIEGLGQDFDIVVFAEKIAERLYPQDNREKVLDCPTPQEVQQWMIAEAPRARVG